MLSAVFLSLTSTLLIGRTKLGNISLPGEVLTDGVKTFPPSVVQVRAVYEVLFGLGYGRGQSFLFFGNVNDFLGKIVQFGFSR